MNAPTPRLATDADNAALLDLFGDVPMRGALVLATQRSPDFFSLYRMQRVEPIVYVGDAEHGLMGMCTALIRDGWLDGRVQKVGYLGDLRIRFDRSRAFPRFFGEAFELRCERSSVHWRWATWGNSAATRTPVSTARRLVHDGQREEAQGNEAREGRATRADRRRTGLSVTPRRARSAGCTARDR